MRQACRTETNARTNTALARNPSLLSHPRYLLHVNSNATPGLASVAVVSLVGQTRRLSRPSHGRPQCNIPYLQASSSSHRLQTNDVHESQVFATMQSCRSEGMRRRRDLDDRIFMQRRCGWTERIGGSRLLWGTSGPPKRLPLLAPGGNPSFCT